MKKITLLATSIILLIFLTGCTGYKPIFNSQDMKFKITKSSITGDQKLGKQLYLKMENMSRAQKNNPDAKMLSVKIDIVKDKSATATSSTGKILEYKITITSKIEVENNQNNEKILDQNFTHSSSYKIQDQYSDTIIQENKIIKNLIDNIYQELLIKLSQKI